MAIGSESAREGATTTGREDEARFEEPLSTIEYPDGTNRTLIACGHSGIGIDGPAIRCHHYPADFLFPAGEWFGFIFTGNFRWDDHLASVRTKRPVN